MYQLVHLLNITDLTLKSNTRMAPRLNRLNHADMFFFSYILVLMFISRNRELHVVSCLVTSNRWRRPTTPTRIVIYWHSPTSYKFVHCLTLLRSLIYYEYFNLVFYARKAWHWLSSVNLSLNAGKVDANLNFIHILYTRKNGYLIAGV